MAINYTNLFEDVGEFVEVINSFRGTIAITTIPAHLSEIEAELTGNSMITLLSGVPEMFLGFQNTMITWSERLAEKISERFRDNDTILVEMPLLTNSAISQVLAELYRKMIEDSETLNGSDVTIGGVSSDLIGTSDGVVLTTDILDGVVAPSSGYPANPFYSHDLSNSAGSGRLPGEHADYAGTLSELCVTSETITITCTTDSFPSGASEGKETFQVVGGLQKASRLSWDTEGSGNGPSITAMNASSIASGGEFEIFSSNAPSGWTIDSGVAGTEILEETTTIKRGSSALKITCPTRAVTAVTVANPTQLTSVAHGLVVGDEVFLAAFSTTPDINGAQTVYTIIDADTFTLDIDVTNVADGVGTVQFDEIQLSQTIVNALQPGRRYAVAVWIQGEATTTSGTLTIQMEGTDYTPGSSEKISMNAAALAAQTSYGVENFFFNCPLEVPTDFELVVKWTGTPTTGKAIFIDGLAFTPVTYCGGIGIVIFAGANPFVVGDRYTFTLANDDAGIFQTFFRKWYKLQLPSNLSAGESINDALASD